MKRFLVILLCFITVFSCTSFADEDVGVIIRGSRIEFDVPPKIIDGRTMVPMRKIFETLNAVVDWIPEAQLILASKDSEIIAMEIGKNFLTVTDVETGVSKNIELDVPPQIFDSRTLVPVRAISEALNMKVSWDSETRIVTIEDIME